tara:strand:- start:7248 stop:7703 length:456 start_codon:yes stop_codon:yes gene_type:complete
MTDTTAPRSPRRTAPTWFWVTAAAGLAWNLFGAVQFLGSLSATPESLQAQGLTAEQASVMLGYPGWMTAAFAVGVGGGVLGCLLLLARNAYAGPVFAASLAGYIILYIGDITEGVFAALGAPQVIILTIVVLIAAGLLLVSRDAARKGILA